MARYLKRNILCLYLIRSRYTNKMSRRFYLKMRTKSTETEICKCLRNILHNIRCHGYTFFYLCTKSSINLFLLLQEKKFKRNGKILKTFSPENWQLDVNLNLGMVQRNEDSTLFWFIVISTPLPTTKTDIKQHRNIGNIEENRNTPIMRRTKHKAPCEMSLLNMLKTKQEETIDEDKNFALSLIPEWRSKTLRKNWNSQYA